MHAGTYSMDSSTAVRRETEQNYVWRASYQGLTAVGRAVASGLVVCVDTFHVTTHMTHES